MFYFTFIEGPIASAVINYSSCRVATITGGILACVAFVTCTLSPNVDVFIAIFGGLGGMLLIYNGFLWYLQSK